MSSHPSLSPSWALRCMRPWLREHLPCPSEDHLQGCCCFPLVRCETPGGWVMESCMKNILCVGAAGCLSFPLQLHTRHPLTLFTPHPKHCVLRVSCSCGFDPQPCSVCSALQLSDRTAREHTACLQLHEGHRKVREKNRLNSMHFCRSEASPVLENACRAILLESCGKTWGFWRADEMRVAWGLGGWFFLAFWRGSRKENSDGMIPTSCQLKQRRETGRRSRGNGKRSSKMIHCLHSLDLSWSDGVSHSLFLKAGQKYFTCQHSHGWNSR